MYTEAPANTPVRPRAHNATEGPRGTQRSSDRARGAGYAAQADALSPRGKRPRQSPRDGFMLPASSPVINQLAPLVRAQENTNRSATGPHRSAPTPALAKEDTLRAEAARLTMRLQVMGYNISSKRTALGTIWCDHESGQQYNAEEYIAFATRELNGTHLRVAPEQFPDIAAHFESWAEVSYYLPSDRDLKAWTPAQWPRPRLHEEIVADNNPIRAAVSENAAAVLPGLEKLNELYGYTTTALITAGAIASVGFGATVVSALEESIAPLAGERAAKLAEASAARRPISALQRQYLRTKVLTDQFLFFRFINRFYPGMPYEHAAQIFALCGG